MKGILASADAQLRNAHASGASKVHAIGYGIPVLKRGPKANFFQKTHAAVESGAVEPALASNQDPALLTFLSDIRPARTFYSGIGAPYFSVTRFSGTPPRASIDPSLANWMLLSHISENGVLKGNTLLVPYRIPTETGY